MRMVYKYTLDLNGLATVTTHRMPAGAQILDAQLQGEEIQLWAVVDAEESDVEAHTFMVVATGFPALDDRMAHISTIQIGATVWHVFEVREGE